MSRKLPVKVHPIADIFPMMSDEEFAGFKADVQEHGVREPIVFWNDQLVDGRNRMAACIELEIDWRDHTCELDADTDPVAYVISHNLHRRHLDTSQRAMVAAKLRPIFEKQAKERQSDAGGDRRTASGKISISDANNYRWTNLPNDIQKRVKSGEMSVGEANAVYDKSQHQTARDAAGEALNVSGKTVDAATAVLETGNKELIAMVEQGEIAVSAVAKQLKEDQATAAEIVKRIKSGEASRNKHGAKKAAGCSRQVRGSPPIDENAIEKCCLALSDFLDGLDGQEVVLAAYWLESLAIQLRATGTPSLITGPRMRFAALATALGCDARGFSGSAAEATNAARKVVREYRNRIFSESELAIQSGLTDINAYVANLKATGISRADFIRSIAGRQVDGTHLTADAAAAFANCIYAEDGSFLPEYDVNSKGATA
jgi:ParB-like chromosome segregation protein Spo0J